MDWPTPVIALPGAAPHLAPAIIDGWTRHGTGSFGALGGATSQAWPANNKAYYYPFTLGTWVTLYQFYFWVGATSSGNIDVGVYTAEKQKIISAGSTGMSATVNTVQTLNVTDTVLPPGDYLVAGACSTTAGTCFRSSQALADEIALSLLPIYEQASALALPDPAVPVLSTDATIGIWAFGMICQPTF